MALDTIPKQEGGKLKAVASGTLPSGQPVVVNADGSVSVVGETSVSQSIGSAQQFVNDNAQSTVVAFDSNSNRIVVGFRDANLKGVAIVGAVNSTNKTITFGTSVIFDAANSIPTGICFDSTNNKVVIAYLDGANGNRGDAIVGTVDPSDNSISFGSSVNFETGQTVRAIPVFDSNSAKVVIVFVDEADSRRGKAIVGTVSGTGISFGSAATFHTDVQWHGAAYDSISQKIAIAYKDGADADKGKAKVATVSGTSISFGSIATFENAAVSEISVAADINSGKIIVAYQDSGNSSFGTAVVGTISSTSISFGTPAVFESATSVDIRVSYDEANSVSVISYEDSGNSNYGTFTVATVSGTNVTFNTPTVFVSNAYSDPASCYDSTAEQIILTNFNSTQKGISFVLQNAGIGTNLTSENYIGMSGGVVDATNTSFGSSSTFESATASEISSAYDTTNNKIVISYRDSGNSLYGTAVVGTVSGTSISFGTPVVYNSGHTRYTSTLFEPVNAKIVISYIDWGNNERPTSIVGTVSGTSISFGSEVVMSAVVGSYMTTAFDTNAGKLVASFRDDSNSGYGRAFVGTVSGTSISFGSAGTYNTATTNTPSMVFDSSNNKIVITYVDAVNADTLTSVVGTVSGTSISFGSEVPLPTSGSAANPVSVFDTNSNKVVVLYTESGTSYAPQAIVGTVSGTSISFSTKVEAGNANDYLDFTSMCFDPDKNQVVIVYEAVTTDAISVKTATVSGDSITFSDPTVVATGPTYSFSIVYDVDTDQVVIAYGDGSDNYYGKSIVGSIGSITRYPVADGDNATVDIVGAVSTNQTGLTAGQQYYVQTDGTLSETPADPSVLAGTAISATKLIVKT
jgi:hypothetical protein